jgi:hypothetical protein
MPISRRQFFRQLWNPDEKSAAQRLARYEALERDARRYFLPYDFSLTEEQETRLFCDLRSILEPLSNEELFSPTVIQRIEGIMEERLRPWREENWAQQRAERAREVRQASPDYVATFLTVQATAQTVEQLRTRLKAENVNALESVLRQRIQTWVEQLPDEEVNRYDIFTVKDAVFDQLRSWC